MTKKTFLNDLQTEDIKPEDLSLDTAPEAPATPEEEKRFYPQIEKFCTAAEAAPLLADFQRIESEKKRLANLPDNL